MLMVLFNYITILRLWLADGGTIFYDIYNIISLLNEGAINFEDLENFSDGLKETVGVFIDR